MKFIKPYFQREDDRGHFVGLLDYGRWEEVNYLKTKAGKIRGNHFHEETTEVFYILSGTIEVRTSVPGKVAETHQVRAGDVIEIPPGETHTFHCLTDCEWLNFLSRKMDANNPDIHSA